MTSELFSSVEISQHLLPICLSLMEDKVAEVRLIAYKLVSLDAYKLVNSFDVETSQIINVVII